ncbi:MAG: hypothetical protein GX568_08870 [Candidatus Gastranaerophilales bacterium]|nr:hypothetical protein [Candidatus Gastranaerophilales bacterium]
MNDRFKFRAYIKAEKRMGQVKSIDFWRSICPYLKALQRKGGAECQK